MADEPVSYLTLQEGTEVVGSDGEPVGKVEAILRDADADIFDGIVIDTTWGPGGHRFVDAPEVERLEADRVILKIRSTEAESLPKPGPNPAVVEHHGAEDSEGPLQHKLRRAWDLLSGRG